MNVAKSKAFSHTRVLGINARSKIILDLQYEFGKALTFRDNQSKEEKQKIKSNRENLKRYGRERERERGAKQRVNDSPMGTV